MLVEIALARWRLAVAGDTGRRRAPGIVAGGPVLALIKSTSIEVLGA